MKVYRIPAGAYFEKQEDARKADRKFEAVEFPFAASPKADFADWLNEQQSVGKAVAFVETISDFAPDLLDRPQGLPPVVGIAQPQPQQPDPAHAARSIALEDAWENLPFAMKAHFAALFCEEAREKIK